MAARSEPAPGHLVQDQHGELERHAGAPVFLRLVHAEQAVFTQLAPELVGHPRFLLPLLVVRDELGLQEAADIVTEQFVLGGVDSRHGNKPVMNKKPRDCSASASVPKGRKGHPATRRFRLPRQLPPLPDRCHGPGQSRPAQRGGAAQPPEPGEAAGTAGLFQVRRPLARNRGSTVGLAGVHSPGRPVLSRGTGGHPPPRLRHGPCATGRGLLSVRLPGRSVPVAWQLLRPWSIPRLTAQP
ncbi:MAG: hypothetical protein K0Q68_2271 [Moraxellaceae bacterium]|nr:hypothetical protein [Moraxellaceae bacterium]